MKKTVAILMTLLMMSCSEADENGSTADNKDLAAATIDHGIKAAKQDTGFDTRIRNNEFKNDLSRIFKDKKLSNNIQGTWELTGNYAMAFLSTELEPRAKVVFLDSLSVTMTGWGKIMYNTSAKFYSADKASDQYEYYVGTNKRLVLTRIEYLNKDLSYKQIPELDTVSFQISLPDKNTLVLSNGTDHFKLKKKNN